MKKFLFLAMAVIAALSSCTSDDIASNENENEKQNVNAPVFKATIESDAISRTQLAEGSTAGKLTKVNWLNTDQVYIWSADKDYTLNVLGKYDVSPVSSDASSATLTAASDIRFVNDGAGDAFFTAAYYPASITKLDYTYDQMKSTTDFTEKGSGKYFGEAMIFLGLPATQKFNGDDISQIAPMGALSMGGTDLEFKNLTSLLAITVSADDFTSISKIVVSSDKQMNSIFVFDTSNMVARAYLKSPTDDEKTVTLDCKNEGANTAIPSNGSKTFYVSIPVNTYGYLQIDVTDGTNTKTMKTTAESITVERNKVYPIAFADNQTKAAPKLNIKVASDDIATLKAIKVVTDQNIDGESKELVYNVPADQQTPAAGGTVYSIEIPSQTYAFYKIYLSADGTTYKEAMASKATVGEISDDVDIDYVKNAVQLWAGGPYFATMNVGETKESGNSKTYQWGIDGTSYYTGTTYENGQIPADYDVATVTWGSAWRMPTQIECGSIENKCNISYSTTGFTLVSKTSGYGSIFLPNNGYWTATPDTKNTACFYQIETDAFEPGEDIWTNLDPNSRTAKLCVRAVLK